MKHKHKEQILYMHYQQLIKHASLLLGNVDDSYDVVHDVFVKFWNAKCNINAKSKIKSYLFTMVNNACFDVLRSTKKYKIIPIDRAVNYSDNTNTFDDNEIKLPNDKILYDYLLQLPDEQSKVIRMRIFGKLSFVEIAKVLNLPVTTVKSRFKYGIDKLRNKIHYNREVYNEM